LRIGSLVSKSELEGRLYRSGIAESNLIEVYISRIRKKLAAASETPDVNYFVVTDHGAGVKVNPHFV